MQQQPPRPIRLDEAYAELRKQELVRKAQQEADPANQQPKWTDVFSLSKSDIVNGLIGVKK